MTTRVVLRALGALVLLALCGCGPPRMRVQPVRYELDVRLDPAAHTLDATASIELRSMHGSRRKGRQVVELQMHPALAVDSVWTEGAILRFHDTRPVTAPPTEAQPGEVVPTIHRFVLEDPEDLVRLSMSYRGSLYQDVAAGEKQGEVHNFAVSAHVGEEGLFLEPGGYWYPRVAWDEDADPALALADYTLAVRGLPGYELVAGLEQEAADGERLRWSSPFPLDGLVLLGGPLQRFSRPHGEVMLHTVLAPGKDAVAQDILDASAEYLDRYTALLGPFPFREFTVLEAFFSSGFAFPTCTQIAGSQLSEHRQYRRHGYLDHELLHNWWGNGVFVDPREGNWCEGLAAYMGNYYGFVLDGDEAGARAQRRNHSNFLSRIDPEDDKPLGSFGLEGGAGRRVGYAKGAAVLHMLARRIGEDRMFAGLRGFAAENMGRFATWDDLQQAVESASGEELDSFFGQWVHGGGAPRLELQGAEPLDAGRLSVQLAQPGTSFDVEVPLRLSYRDGRSVEVVAPLSTERATLELACDTVELEAVELDPDYHLFRKLAADEVMPTSLLTRDGPELIVVVPAGDLAEGYAIARDNFAADVTGDEDAPDPGKVSVRQAGQFTAAELAGGDVLVLGDAVEDPVLASFLARTRSPVRWDDRGFEIEGERYDGPGHAVLFTVHHPDLADGGVTVYRGNSPAALANARVLGYYANSLLVFESPEDAAPSRDLTGGMPPSTVVRRMDFEFHDRVEF